MIDSKCDHIKRTITFSGDCIKWLKNDVIVKIIQIFRYDKNKEHFTGRLKLITLIV